MGIYVNYTLIAEGADADILARLRSLRKRFLKLRGVKVGKILRLDAIFNEICLEAFERAGYRVPKPIRDRWNVPRCKEHGVRCILVGNPDWMNLPKKLLNRYYRPAEDFIKKTDLWQEKDLPDKVTYGSWIFSRKGIEMEFASTMLRHGYLMILNPGEGCETVHIGLSTMGGNGVPLWLGSGGTKTQYATHFTEAHENVCRIVDCVQEEGLLREASDTCEFYKHRDWKKAAPIVNMETTFAHVMKGVFSAAIAAASDKGVEIQDLSHPDTWNYNLLHVKDGENPKK
jgi:hypothetical protein